MQNNKRVIKVFFDPTDPSAMATVRVTETLEPHPQGLAAEILQYYGPGRIDGGLSRAIMDNAMDFCKGKTTVMKCEGPVVDVAPSEATQPSETGSQAQ